MQGHVMHSKTRRCKLAFVKGFLRRFWHPCVRMYTVRMKSMESFINETPEE